MKGKQEDYKGYDEYLMRKFNMTIEEMYGEHPVYKERNLAIVEFMKKDNPKHVFEFASTYGFLALEVMKAFPDINYECTNFLPEVVEYSRKQGVKSFLFDANDIPYVSWTKLYDSFICTSLEHLENDVRIIDSLPEYCTIYFCVTNMDDETHFWGFESEWDVYERYSDVMRIIDYKLIKSDEKRMKMIGRGKRD